MRLRQVCMNYVAVSACASASTTSGCQCLCNCLYHCQRPSEQAQAASRATNTEPNTTTRSLKTYRKSRPPREGLRGKTWPHSHCERNRAATHCAEASARTRGRRQGPRRCRPSAKSQRGPSPSQRRRPKLRQAAPTRRGLPAQSGVPHEELLVPVDDVPDLGARPITSQLWTLHRV